mgnify:CR=1 FL=1
MVEWAQRYDLWILADEVYEDYVYRGEHCYARALAPERTYSVHSLSKASGMAGNRCGYVVRPADHMRQFPKAGHQHRKGRGGGAGGRGQRAATRRGTGVG